MATSLADPPPRAAGEQPAAPPATPPAGAGGLGAQHRVCANCGAPMASAQDWCLHCGAGAPGSLDSHAHRWRSGAAVLSALALLIAGAAAAAYAALNKSSAKPRPALAALAHAPAPAASPPAAPATPPSASATPPPATPKVGAPSVKVPVPLAKTPKLPPATAAPKPAATTTPSTTGATTTPAASTKKPAGTGGTTQKQPTALVLDTNAASTYNPYAYPPSNFGDPSLAIDGETSTAWTALVDPAVAPRMAEGLVIDLRTPQKLSTLALTTSTPGMTVQVYGAAGGAPPASITDPAWVPLSRLLVESKSYERIALGQSKQAFRFVTLWISKAPASAVGPPTHPRHVRIGELELFPAG